MHNMHQKAHNPPKEPQSSDLDKVKMIYFYHKWVIIITFLLTSPVLLFFASKIPPKYKAATTILVIPQKISTEYVKPTVSATLTERLQTITQEIMSRTRILKVMSKLNLIKGLKEQNAIEEMVNETRKMIKLTVAKSSSFQITCKGKDPELVAGIANATASIFIDETLKRNAQQAKTTTQFLDDELAAIKIKLEAQEGKVSSFKKRYMGELPDQEEAILRSLDRLQLQIQTGDGHITEAQRQKKMLSSLKKQYIAGMKVNVNANGYSGQVLKYEQSPLEQRLAKLKERLEQLKADYSDAWPEVIKVKKKIFYVESALKKEEKEIKNTKVKKQINIAGNNASKPSLRNIRDESLDTIENNLIEVTLRLKTLSEKQSKILKRYKNLHSQG